MYARIILIEGHINNIDVLQYYITYFSLLTLNIVRKLWLKLEAKNVLDILAIDIILKETTRIEYAFACPRFFRVAIVHSDGLEQNWEGQKNAVFTNVDSVDMRLVFC